MTYFEENLSSNSELAAEMVPTVAAREDRENQLAEILAIILNYGGIDGGHHKQWVLDQVVRIATEDNYTKFTKEYSGAWDEEEEEFEYGDWDEGIAP